MRKTVLAVLSIAAVLALAAPCGAKDYRALQRLVDQAGGEWTVGPTALSEMTSAELAALFNLDFSVPPGAQPELARFDLPMQVADHLDWRDIDGRNFMTPVKDQHPCGTCATFSSVGATEALLKIAVDNPFVEPDLSEQHVYSCAGAFPYTFFHPLTVLQQQGAPDEPCFPYDCQSADYRAPCEDTCDDWASREFKIDGYEMLFFPTPEQMIAALQDGPIVAGFQAFADFRDYTGGIYEHTYGELLGGHGVVVAGYDVAEQYWICKNSWGTSWGEEGWFKIRWSTGLLGFGYQSFDILASYESFCGEHVAPTLTSLNLLNAGPELLQDEQLKIDFEFSDPDADMRGAELWYAVDDGADQRWAEPLRELIGSSSAGLDLPEFVLPGTYAPGEHSLRVYLSDICGLRSNELSATFTVEGAAEDDDDDAAGDDDDDSAVCGG